MVLQLTLIISDLIPLDVAIEKLVALRESKSIDSRIT